MCELYKLKNSSNISLASIYSWEGYLKEIGIGINNFKTTFYWQYKDYIDFGFS